MRADDARKRYQMTLMSEDEKSYGVSIKPKLKVDKESFSLAFVKLDKQVPAADPDHDALPDGKSTEGIPAWGRCTRTRKVNDKNFEGKPLGPPWKVVRNPAGEERPRAEETCAPGGDGPADPAAARPAPGRRNPDGAEPAHRRSPCPSIEPAIRPAAMPAAATAAGPLQDCGRSAVAV